MTYAKFVTRVNKEGKPVNYGPYYYKSVRTPDGKVRNIYLGTEPANKGNGNGKIGKIREMLAALRSM